MTKRKKGELSGKELDRVDGGALKQEGAAELESRRRCEKYDQCRHAGTMGRCKHLNGFPYCGKWPN